MRQEQTIEGILNELIDTNAQILARLETLSVGAEAFLDQHGITLSE